MKYIMFEIKYGSLTERIPIIFPSKLVHADIAESIKTTLIEKYNVTPQIVSAGDIAFAMDCNCSGSSETLGLSAQPEIDDNVINMNDYGGSFSC